MLINKEPLRNEKPAMCLLMAWHREVIERNNIQVCRRPDSSSVYLRDPQWSVLISSDGKDHARGVVQTWDFFESMRKCCLKYLERKSRPKSRKISFVYKIHISRTISLKFSTEYDNITAVLRTKFQKDFSTENAIMYNDHFSLRQISDRVSIMLCALGHNVIIVFSHIHKCLLCI